MQPQEWDHRRLVVSAEMLNRAACALLPSMSRFGGESEWRLTDEAADEIRFASRWLLGALYAAPMLGGCERVSTVPRPQFVQCGEVARDLSGAPVIVSRGGLVLRPGTAIYVDAMRVAGVN